MPDLQGDFTPPEGRGGPEVRPRVSICIPAFNEEQNIRSLLTFLKAEVCTRGVVSEILVDTSGSTDRTPQTVTDFLSEWAIVRILTGNERAGLTAALVDLVDTARGDVIVRLDADTIPERGFLDQLLRALENPRVGIAGPRVIPMNTGDSLCDILSFAEFELHHSISLLSPKTTIIQAFRRIPLNLSTDEGAEDVAIQAAIGASGYSAMYVPGTSVRVLPPAPFNQFFKQRVRTIRASRSLQSKRGIRSPTQDPQLALQASLSSVRDGSLSLFAALAFIGTELLAHLASRMGRRATGVSSLSRFPQIDATKSPEWN